MIRSTNPVFRSTFEGASKARATTGLMTIQGTVNSGLILIGFTGLTAMLTWNYVFTNPQLIHPLLILGALGGFITAMVTIFKPSIARYTSFLYAGLEGMVLGIISGIYEAAYPGIAIRALLLTFGVFASLLLAYKSRWITVTNKFRAGFAAAAGGIFLVYFITIIIGWFGANVSFLWDSSPLGIGINLVFIVMASIFLVLDFDSIERGANAGMPKYMEWYAAFGLLVTLIWMYLEILRLLGRLRR